ncbi:transmembrane protein [Burkholderia pseudomallei]|nr:transmembrane protein [Burkholderia pseudomallei]
MSSAPATKEELDFALKVRRALDERAASLPAATADRLAAARRAALARKKPDAAIVLVPALAGGAGTLELRPPGEPRSSLARRLAGLIGIAYWEDMQRTAELADIDAAMLSDDLPLTAYLDHGFNAYLSHTH